MNDKAGQIEVIQSEFNNPANAGDREWLGRELKRLGVADPYAVLKAQGQSTGAPASKWAEGAGIPIDSPEAQTLMAQAASEGALSKAAKQPQVTEPMPEPQQGALSRTASATRQPIDMAEMLQRFVPQDDSSNKYLAMAAALGKPTNFGTFGERMANVADALMTQKQNQEKLRAQYTPLIMQQVAAQQSREEQNAYRLEAQQQAQESQRQAQQAHQYAQSQAAALAQQHRVDLAAQNQASMDERAAADRASREALASNRPAPAPHYTIGSDGNQLIIDPVTGRARPVVDQSGNPVGSRPASARMSAALQKELIESDDTVQSSKAVKDLLGQALKLNDTAYSGYGAKGRAIVRSNLPGQSTEADATINLDNIMTSQALESLKLIFGGMPTEGERKVLLEMQASAEKTPTQRKAIIDRAIQAAENRSKYATQKASSIRGGSFLTKGVGEDTTPAGSQQPKQISFGDLK